MKQTFQLFLFASLCISGQTSKARQRLTTAVTTADHLLSYHDFEMMQKINI